MTSHELVHEINEEKDSSIQTLKAKISRLNKHHASLIPVSDEGQQASVVSDEILIRNNTVPYIFANASTDDSYGNEISKQPPENNNERSYQIKLLGPSKHDRIYVAEQNESHNTEVVISVLMILLAVVVAIILYMVVHDVKHNSMQDDRKTYIIMAHSNNSDPVLRDMRYMPIPEDHPTCLIM